jgi:signal transduction histidine kinase
MLARKGSAPDQLHKLSARIIENLDRADRMLLDLLDANRIRAGEPLQLEFARFDLVPLARETLEELALIHGNRISFAAPESLEGEWSSEGVRRVLENLCGNAIKYGAHDRPVTVTLAEHGPGEVALSVHNWGKAISPEEQEHLFRPYRRASTSADGGQRGWGLGLTLVDGLVRAHGGRVEVASATETGTTFTVTLPRYRSHG